MSAPLVVNTKDGTCWTRRTVTSGGIALYAPERVRTCPEFVMATLPELAEQGIVGSAFALPMPVGPEPQPRTLLDLARNALNARMAKDDLRLVLGNVIDYAARLEAERHSTNESLSDAAEQLRANRDRITELEARLAEREQPADTYPPALPWARLMDDDDLIEFLTELAGVMQDARHMATLAGHVHARRILDGLEKTCGTWRLIAEAQHAHNTAPGPDAEEDCDHPNGYGPNGCGGCGAFRPADDEDDDPARCLEVHPFSPRDGWRMICGSCDHGQGAPCHKGGA